MFLIFSFKCMFCWSLFVPLYLFFWPLCCLFFDILILIAPLVSSNSSIMLTTSGTYPWSSVTQIFHRGDDRKSDDFNLTKRNPWFSSFLVSSHPLSRKSLWEPQALEYRINWEIYTPSVGIPMGTNCTPLLADLFLYLYEADFIQGLFKKNEKKLAWSFNFTSRNVATYKWKVHNGEIEIISFVVKFRS
jgi:hypothetical protein